MPQPLIKYIGNKYRSASRIINAFPNRHNIYYEPFLGSGAVLGQLQPKRSVACDICKPLIEFWKLVQSNPQSLLDSYRGNWALYIKDRQGTYDTVKYRFNSNHNPHDFLFLSRACYGGVIRFRKDGYFSTPLGAHTIISPDAFSKRLSVWRPIVRETSFIHGDFSEVIENAGSNDIVYCDPPYLDTQAIIYGSQGFSLQSMYSVLREAKERGSFIALSIDGIKNSGKNKVNVQPPNDLFEIECYLELGGSMLKRFWKKGGNTIDDRVRDRLLLSHDITPQTEMFEDNPVSTAIR